MLVAFHLLGWELPTPSLFQDFILQLGPLHQMVGSDILPILILGLKVSYVPDEHPVSACSVCFEEVSLQVLCCLTPSGREVSKTFTSSWELVDVVANLC